MDCDVVSFFLRFETLGRLQPTRSFPRVAEKFFSYCFFPGRRGSVCIGVGFRVDLYHP